MNNKKPDIKVCISSIFDEETKKEYWSVNWSFIYNNELYGNYILSTKERYSQSECMKNAIEIAIEQAEDLYKKLNEPISDVLKSS